MEEGKGWTGAPGFNTARPFFKDYFLMWTIFKVFIECVTILLLFYVLAFLALRPMGS